MLSATNVKFNEEMFLTTFNQDANFSLSRKGIAEGIECLNKLSNYLIIKPRATGIEAEIDNVLSLAYAKVIAGSIPETYHYLFNSSYIPNIMYSYMHTNCQYFKDHALSQSEIKSVLDKLQSDINEVDTLVFYKKSDFQSFQLLNIKLPDNIKVFYLQDLYKKMDKGLSYWKYSLYGLAYRLKIPAIKKDEKSYVEILQKCLDKLRKIFIYTSTSLIEHNFKTYNKTRSIIKKAVIIQEDNRNSLFVQIKQHNPAVKAKSKKDLLTFYISEKDGNLLISPDANNSFDYQLTDDDLLDIRTKIKTENILSYLKNSLDY